MHKAIFAIALGVCPAAFAANAPCDANTAVKACRAEVRIEGNFVVLRSSTPNCSVIEWTLDGRGRSTTVLDGQERLELLTTRPEQLSVESCTEVEDLRAASSRTGRTAQVVAAPDWRRYCRPVTGQETLVETSASWYCLSRMGEGVGYFVWCKDGSTIGPAEIRIPAPARGTRYFQLKFKEPKTPEEARELALLEPAYLQEGARLQAEGDARRDRSCR
jgi:hypothetical protein